jgi:hypothetical protein
MYCRSKSNTAELSGRWTISEPSGSREAAEIASAEAKPSECSSRFLRCTLYKTPSDDCRVISESGAQTVFLVNSRSYNNVWVIARTHNALTPESALADYPLALTCWGCMLARVRQVESRGQ